MLAVSDSTQFLSLDYCSFRYERVMANLPLVARDGIIINERCFCIYINSIVIQDNKCIVAYDFNKLYISELVCGKWKGSSESLDKYFNPLITKVHLTQLNNMQESL